MNLTINAKELRASLPKLVERVRQGARFTVLYRGRRAFQIVPVDEADAPRGAARLRPIRCIAPKRWAVLLTRTRQPTTTHCFTARERYLRRHGGPDGLRRRERSGASGLVRVA